MSKVITFSRTFPKGHQRDGERTHFVEKIWSSLVFDCMKGFDPSCSLDEYSKSFLQDEYREYYSNTAIEYKHHTIRTGRRYKAGDWFSPRIWSGKPYNSKQITFAPDIEIKKTWDIEIDACGVIALGEAGKQVYYIEEGVSERLAENDGLSELDFFGWLIAPIYNAKKPKEFSGQVICWNEEIEY